jgi:hypothetical protein
MAQNLSPVEFLAPNRYNRKAANRQSSVCGRGGTGRRVGLRIQLEQSLGGSNPLGRTIFFFPILISLLASIFKPLNT